MQRSLLALLASQALCAASSSLPIRLETRSELSSRLANVHVIFNEVVEGALTYTYGSCSSLELRDAHHTVGRSTDATTSRLVWIMPENADSAGCLSAWDNVGKLVGRSEPQHFKLRRRSLEERALNSIEMSNATGIDTWGPWFNGVELLESKNLSSVDVETAKSKQIAIVGAGMSGLMTYLVLSQSGFTNISILEAAQRLGGRVHTEYLSGGPFNYSYQEMGPMRFPETVVYSNETYNITDHRLVFQLAAEMNKINGNNKNLSVDFIPWHQASENGLYYHNGIKLDNGLPPTLAQIEADPSLAVASVENPSTTALEEQVNMYRANETLMIELAENMFKTHSEFIREGLNGLGGDQFSEFAFMVNYLGASLNDTDVVSGGAFGSSFWDDLYEGMYFEAATWKTIDGGLSRLPLSFHPLVDNITSMNTKVQRVEFIEEEQKVKLQWKNDYTDSTFQNATYDYAVMALPFSIVKKMRLPSMPATITNAISNLPFESACKVALEFQTRFWEHYENPIYGGCSTSTDIPGVGSICYPSYNINGTGPASMLASYISGDWGVRWVSTPEAEHVQYIIDAMAEIHGDVVYEQYTGNYNRRCWALDPYEGGSWASPLIGQHQLYIPEYFKTYNNMIFVGEQTSYTHAWIASALESGIRGAVQLMLEEGLVDEAKVAVEKWMARWIEV
ncbi:L-amino acid oxidase [Pseudomassariella vexata]|uniref:L-amino acid oxidase n=1 Tax=Pseudomassariella vexata TaxID=1141098 RepID=A0A1Y2EJ48_9PEZI|nr:L-amino acid oxidase [Pseudomassariella vexata]ORY71487.1 L-amino acid oxidase [Pseudomassariella vexata]